MNAIITDIHGLIKALNNKPKKILLSSSLYDWMLRSNWDCVLSEELKKYIENGGIVERVEIKNSRESGG